MRKPRTLNTFVLTANQPPDILKIKGHCRIILDILRSQELGTLWTSRDVIEELEKHPRFRTSGTTFRTVNFWLWKLRDAKVIQWLDSTDSDLATFSVAERMGFLKSTFGFTALDLAKVLLVERPTLYAWLDGAVPNPANMRRLNRLFELAGEVRDAAGRVSESKFTRSFVYEGRTLVELLIGASDLSSDPVRLAIARFAESLKKKNQSLRSTKLIAPMYVQEASLAQLSVQLHNLED